MKDQDCSTFNNLFTSANNIGHSVCPILCKQPWHCVAALILISFGETNVVCTEPPFKHLRDPSCNTCIARSREIPDLTTAKISGTITPPKDCPSIYLAIEKATELIAVDRSGVDSIVVYTDIL